MKHRLLAVFLLAMTLVSTTGCSILAETKNIGPKESTSNSEILYSGQYYIWHDDDTNDITEDIGLGDISKEKPLFTPVYEGIKKFNSDPTHFGSTSRVVMTNTYSERKIPTFYKGDELVFYSEEEIPAKFTIERFYDLGYSAGLFGIYKLGESNVYQMDLSGNDKSVGFLTTSQGAVDIYNVGHDFKKVSIIKIGGMSITDENLSEIGSIIGLKKDKEYNISYALGTNQYSTKIACDAHLFYSMESFDVYDVTWIKDDLVTITLPDYLKTGYYYVNSIGMFRYIADGTEWNNKTNFNDPIIVRDENNQVISDPSQPVEESSPEVIETPSVDEDSSDDDAYSSEAVSLKTNQQLTIKATYESNEDEDTRHAQALPFAIICKETEDANHYIQVSLESGVEYSFDCLVNSDETANADGPTAGNLFTGDYDIAFYGFNNYGNIDIDVDVVDIEEDD